MSNAKRKKRKNPKTKPSEKPSSPAADLPLDPAPKTEAKDEETVHEDVFCDVCSMSPIRGVRFKCTTCKDFDLCGSCEAKGAHPRDHVLLKLKKALAPDEEEEKDLLRYCSFTPPYNTTNGFHSRIARIQIRSLNGASPIIAR